MPLMRSGKLTAPSWRCTAPESAMSLGVRELRAAESRHICLHSVENRGMFAPSPPQPPSGHWTSGVLLRQMDRRACRLSFMRTTLLSCRTKSSPNLQKKRAFERFLKMRPKQRQQIETQPKVGNEGSNPFARSKFPQGRQADKKCRSGRFLLTWPSFPSLESRR